VVNNTPSPAGETPLEFRDVASMTDAELLAEHDLLCTLAIRLEEVCREMSKRAQQKTDELLAKASIEERLRAILKR
jgi:hypothetical protein